MQQMTDTLLILNQDEENHVWLSTYTDSLFSVMVTWTEALVYLQRCSHIICELPGVWTERVTFDMI